MFTDLERECIRQMEEKSYQTEGQKEDISYLHRSHFCGLSSIYKVYCSGRGVIVLNSIKKNSSFVYVYQNGKSYANKYLVMYVLKNGLEENRFGITVSKKVGNSVVRHRVTRLIRESIRLNLEQFEKGFDIIIVARNTAKGKKFCDVESAVLHLGRLDRKSVV